MEELIFIVEESPEGGFIAKGLGIPIFTQAENLSELKEVLMDAIQCYFDPITNDLQ